MWFVVAMAIAAVQVDTLRTENVRLDRENEDFQLRVIELRYRLGWAVRTAEMTRENRPLELMKEYLSQRGLTEGQLRDGDLLNRAERAELKRLSDEVEALMKRLDPNATPQRLDGVADQMRREALPVNQNARLKAEQRRLGRELMGLVLDSLPLLIRGR